jgi:hypothetical protein
MGERERKYIFKGARLMARRYLQGDTTARKCERKIYKKKYDIIPHFYGKKSKKMCSLERVENYIKLNNVIKVPRAEQRLKSAWRSKHFKVVAEAEKQRNPFAHVRQQKKAIKKFIL